MSQPTIISYGGGINSTALVIAMVKTDQAFDAIIFADTGAEKESTYATVQRLSDWLVSSGRSEIIRVRKTESLEDYCLDRKMLPSLAYGFNQCSGDYKIKPIHRWGKNWEPAVECWNGKEKVIKCIGFDNGPRDLARSKKFRDDYPSKYQLRYPLIEMRLDRKLCETLIRNEGIEVPEKSCCFFCPAHKKAEVIELSKNHPDLFARAIVLEDTAKETLTTAKGLGRNFSWKTLVENDAMQSNFLRDDEPELSCVCGR